MHNKTNDTSVMWSHNPEEGQVIGVLITEPKLMSNILELHGDRVVTTFILDANKRKWRVRANCSLANKLLTCSIGHKIRVTGVKGDLCKGAYDSAKRQIVPSQIEIKNH